MATLVVTSRRGVIVEAGNVWLTSNRLIMNAERMDHTHVRIVADAVVGGGAVRMQGEIVERECFGEYADTLCRFGAIEPMPEDEVPSLTH